MPRVNRSLSLLLGVLMATASTVGLQSPSVAAKAPAGATVRQLDDLPSRTMAARKSTTSCNGVSYAHNGLSYGLGNGMRFLLGFGDAGNPRMVKVYSANGSPANIGLGPIASSGAVVESWQYGVSSYCIPLPRGTVGVVIRTRKDGVATNDTIRF